MKIGTRALLEALRASHPDIEFGTMPGGDFERRTEVVYLVSDETNIVDPLSSPGPHCEPVDPKQQYGISLKEARAVREHNRIYLT